jgi:type II secretory pathway pseudopilin PulG
VTRQQTKPETITPGRPGGWPKPHGGRRHGWTLLECLLVVAILGTLCAVSVPLIHAGAASFNTAQERILATQEARFALAHAATAIRQARAVTTAADDGAGTASLTFLGSDGTAMTFGRSSGTNNLLFGPVGSTALLSNNCQALSIDCYDSAGQKLALPLASPSGVSTVDLAMTARDPKGRFSPTSVKTRAGLLRNQPTVIINEIFYHGIDALGGTDAKTQWVELYNASSQPVDVNGWYLWTKDQTPADCLQPDSVYSSGSTIIPAGGCAIVTGQTTTLYQDVLKNGDFETTDMAAWRFSLLKWQRVAGDAYSGSYKIQIRGGAWVTMYQDFKLPSAHIAAKVHTRARLKQGSLASSRLTLRVTDRGATVLVPIYDGPATAGWTTYSASATPVINRDARLELKVYSSGVNDLMDIDAVCVFGTTFPAHSLDSQHIWVDDDQVGKDLKTLQVFFVQGNAVRDVVAWSKTWGGDGDGTSLSRVSPYAPSTEQTSWRPGPYGGTPGAPN